MPGPADLRSRSTRHPWASRVRPTRGPAGSALVVAVVAVGLATAVLPAGPAGAAALAQTTVCDSTRTTSSAANVQALFNRFHTAAWGGADGGFGTRVPDGRTLLAFGDTFQDPTGLNANGSRKADARMRHNSLMFIGGRCLGALMGAGQSEPLPNAPDGTYYWPGQPTVFERPGRLAGDRIWIPALHVQTTQAGASWGFHVLNTTLFAFDLPRGGLPTYYGRFPMPSFTATNDIHFGGGAYSDATYLYLYGGRHAPNTYFGSNIYLARVAHYSVSTPSAYQYYYGGGVWGSDVTRAALVAGPNAAGSAPSGGVSVGPLAGGFGWIGHNDEYAGDGLYAWRSTGMTRTPYARSPLLVAAPSDAVYYRYAGAAHPEHALSSGAVLTSYSRNPRDGALLTANGNAYMPQWVEVAPSAVTAPAPSTAALAVPQTSAEQNDPVRRKRPPDAQDPRGLVRLAR